MNINELTARARRAAGQPEQIDASPYASISALLTHAASVHAMKPAFSCMGATLSYGELDRLSAAFAAWPNWNGVKL